MCRFCWHLLMDSTSCTSTTRPRLQKSRITARGSAVKGRIMLSQREYNLHHMQRKYTHPYGIYWQCLLASKEREFGVLESYFQCFYVLVSLFKVSLWKVALHSEFSTCSGRKPKNMNMCTITPMLVNGLIVGLTTNYISQQLNG